MINSFTGQYRWLSNFWSCTIIDKDGNTWLSAEAAFQACKCNNPQERDQFISLSAGEARKLGRRVSMRTDWNDIRLSVMESIVRRKFTQNKDLQRKLLDTGTQELVEGNPWGDTFWGMCKGRGHNHLGKILMRIREESDS
tara:strand:+ start:35 stop:454 length:420 start_codon:yes stop_codon:yes gene_type:complete